MGKVLLLVIYMVFFLAVFFGADADIAWCVTVQKYFIYSIVWGLFALVVLEIIIFILSVFE